MKSSDHLIPGTIYTRQDLREKFKTNDATLNTGIFRPKDHNSIWLLITADNNEYRNSYDGENLSIDGQNKGLKDKILIDHEKNGDEVLLFFRKTKTEHPAGGYRYEGRFKYLSHTATKPAHFHFQRVKQ
jgi:putative restriction endonuclease